MGVNRRLLRPEGLKPAPVFQVDHHVLGLFSAVIAQPLIVAGGGTLSMEIALVNLVAPGERATCLAALALLAA